MSSAVSTNYRELSPHEVQSVADECAQAWQDATIPARQWEIVKPELEKLRQGKPCAPYAALIECLSHLPQRFIDSRPRLLDVGASSGSYREVLDIAGYGFRYTGIDFSRAFQRFALAQYPDMDYDLGDACALPYQDETFDVVLSGAALMHIRDYPKAIEEAARVARQYVIFHRSPVWIDKPTTAYVKDGYGVPMLEWHFNEAELTGLFRASNLDMMHECDVFRQGGFAHRSYLLRKLSLSEREWERA